jgi:tagaturonate reductase
MQLSKQNLKNISSQPGLIVPDERLFSLPERVLQFGTGVLLRGLPDYFIDKANRQGIFNGRVVVVKSTVNGGTDEFDEQDNLYTICIKGIDNGKKIEEFIINSSISRVVSANEDWTSILQCAANPELRIIISNTTEVGITLTEDDIEWSPPKSFPGKLLSFLYERYKIFNGGKQAGLVIIPTELIPDNGSKLLSIVVDLAKINNLEETFVNWLQSANYFCSSLVDRIVPGKLEHDDKISEERKLGYEDELMIMAEPFRLWAIESGDEEVKRILSFTQADDGVILAPDIEKFRELKLRLLNGVHSLSCGLAFLGGFKTVREAMDDPLMASFIYNLSMHEVAVAMSNGKISYNEACDFAIKVLDRFRNPFIDHQWLSITVQYSSKMKMRTIPLLVKHYHRYSYTPEYMALGFAAYLLFMKCTNENGSYVGLTNSTTYPVHDDHAAYFAESWKHKTADQLVDSVLADKGFWESDLTSINGFAEAVKRELHLLMREGVAAALRNVTLNKTTVPS